MPTNKYLELARLRLEVLKLVSERYNVDSLNISLHATDKAVRYCLTGELPPLAENQDANRERFRRIS